VSKTQWPLPEAERIAAARVADLAPAYTRIQVAGSVRRRTEVVGDIEMVAIPCYAPASSATARPISSASTCTPATPTASP
jgi:DNA polymerase/3'-5' exonuclease PolX